jgi:hypothetical protein
MKKLKSVRLVLAFALTSASAFAATTTPSAPTDVFGKVKITFNKIGVAPPGQKYLVTDGTASEQAEIKSAQTDDGGNYMGYYGSIEGGPNSSISAFWQRYWMSNALILTIHEVDLFDGTYDMSCTLTKDADGKWSGSGAATLVDPDTQMLIHTLTGGCSLEVVKKSSPNIFSNGNGKGEREF